MNTYLIPIADISSEPDVWIEVIKAKNYSEAKDKLMHKLTNEWDLDVPADWDDFEIILSRAQVIIGEIQDIDEF